MKWQAVFSILFIIIAVLLVLSYVEISRKTPIAQTLNNSIFSDDNKALLTHITNGWEKTSGGNIAVNVALYNYGYEEAENVEITCEMYDRDEEGNFESDEPISMATLKFGNIDPTSYEKLQVYVDDNEMIDDYSGSSCFIKRCENCDILDNRLKE